MRVFSLVFKYLSKYRRYLTVYLLKERHLLAWLVDNLSIVQLSLVWELLALHSVHRSQFEPLQQKGESQRAAGQAIFVL
jgi:hypothetical protein